MGGGTKVLKSVHNHKTASFDGNWTLESIVEVQEYEAMQCVDKLFLVTVFYLLYNPGVPLIKKK